VAYFLGPCRGPIDLRVRRHSELYEIAGFYIASGLSRRPPKVETMNAERYPSEQCGSLETTTAFLLWRASLSLPNHH